MLNPLVQRDYAVARALVYTELSQVLACSLSHPEQRPGLETPLRTRLCKCTFLVF